MFDVLTPRRALCFQVCYSKGDPAAGTQCGEPPRSPVLCVIRSLIALPSPWLVGVPLCCCGDGVQNCPPTSSITDAAPLDRVESLAESGLLNTCETEGPNIYVGMVWGGGGGSGDSPSAARFPVCPPCRACQEQRAPDQALGGPRGNARQSGPVITSYLARSFSDGPGDQGPTRGLVAGRKG